MEYSPLSYSWLIAVISTMLIVALVAGTLLGGDRAPRFIRKAIALALFASCTAFALLSFTPPQWFA